MAPHLLASLSSSSTWGPTPGSRILRVPNTPTCVPGLPTVQAPNPPTCVPGPAAGSSSPTCAVGRVFDSRNAQVPNPPTRVAGPATDIFRLLHVPNSPTCVPGPALDTFRLLHVPNPPTSAPGPAAEQAPNPPTCAPGPAPCPGLHTCGAGPVFISRLLQATGHSSTFSASPTFSSRILQVPNSPLCAPGPAPGSNISTGAVDQFSGFRPLGPAKRARAFSSPSVLGTSRAKRSQPQASSLAPSSAERSPIPASLPPRAGSSNRQNVAASAGSNRSPNLPIGSPAVVFALAEAHRARSAYRIEQPSHGGFRSTTAK